jgi:hypothetical protein
MCVSRFFFGDPWKAAVGSSTPSARVELHPASQFAIHVDLDRPCHEGIF